LPLAQSESGAARQFGCDTPGELNPSFRLVEKMQKLGEALAEHVVNTDPRNLLRL
jgi:hypothetical protein